MFRGVRQREETGRIISAREERPHMKGRRMKKAVSKPLTAKLKKELAALV
jgi:hypothetical protein